MPTRQRKNKVNKKRTFRMKGGVGEEEGMNPMYNDKKDGNTKEDMGVDFLKDYEYVKDDTGFDNIPNGNQYMKDDKIDDPESLLFVALQNNNLARFNALLPNILYPNATKKGGNGFLHFVAKDWMDDKSIESIINALLEKGADPNIQNNKGNTPLHYLAFKGNDTLVNTLAQIFLEKGADPNIKNNEGNTPLHVAIFKGKSNIVNSLLEKGAEPNIKNNEEKTPLDIAKSRGFAQILVRLQTKESLKHAREVRSPMHKGGKRNKKRNRTIKRKKNQ